jgi:predicted transcriptional regulator
MHSSQSVRCPGLKKQDECWLYMTKELMRARKGDTVEDITNRCLTNGFSQIPVFDGDRYLGLMTEIRLLELQKPYQALFIEYAERCLPLVPKTASCAVKMLNR